MLDGIADRRIENCAVDLGIETEPNEQNAQQIANEKEKIKPTDYQPRMEFPPDTSKCKITDGANRQPDPKAIAPFQPENDRSAGEIEQERKNQIAQNLPPPHQISVPEIFGSLLHEFFLFQAGQHEFRPVVQNNGVELDLPDTV